MKNTRKIFAVILSVLMIMSVMVIPTFAASEHIGPYYPTNPTSPNYVDRLYSNYYGGQLRLAYVAGYGPLNGKFSKVNPMETLYVPIELGKTAKVKVAAIYVEETCPYCGLYANDIVADEITVSRILADDSSIVNNANIEFGDCSNDYDPYLVLTLDGVKPGQTTVTFYVASGYNVSSQVFQCRGCDRLFESPARGWEKYPLTLNVTVCDHVGYDREYEDNHDGATHDGFCTNCGLLVIDDEAHTFGDWTETKAPTCGAEGVQTRECTKCGAKETAAIEATGDHTYEWVDNGDGTHDGICTNCNLLLVDDEAHTFGDWTETKAPTCGAEGVQTRECTKCGAKETAAIEATGDHTYEWTDNGDGTHDGSCTNCGQLLVENEAHTFGDWTETKAPTCGAEGVQTRECTKCGAKETAAIEATGNHTYEWTDNGDGTHDGSCTNCGQLLVENEAHTFGDWTETKAPTCGAEGVQTRECTKCGAKETAAIEATGNHDYKWVDNGNGTHDEKCSVCGDVKTDDEAHTFGNWTETKAPTCVAAGEKTAKCTKCGATVTESIPATGKHVDKNKDHKCDTCGKELSKCADNNNDHKCDICGKQLGDCKDNDNDGKCDICGKDLTIKPLGNCSDLLSMLFKAILEALLSMFKGIC